MRKTALYGSLCFLLSIFNFQLSTAQHYIGLTGGYGAMQGRFYPVYEKDMVWGKYNGGIAWKYYSPQQVVGGVGAELQYMMRGFRIYLGQVTDAGGYTSVTRTVSSISLPLIWQPHIYLAKRHLRVFVNAAFVLTYNLGIGDTETRVSYGSGRVPGEPVVTSYEWDIARDNRWNYGIFGGAGFGVLFGRWEITAEARYYYGMSDILRTKTKYIFNDYGTIRSELDNLTIGFGVFFRLGKGGITEPPLRKRVAPPASDSDFRNIKLDNMRY